MYKNWMVTKTLNMVMIMTIANEIIDGGTNMDVPVGVWIASALIIVVLAWITFWVTNKAYSRRWEDEGNENK